MSRGEVQSTSTLNDWAGYVDRMNRQDLTWSRWSLVECSPNRLTPLYSEIHYEEENYLKVRTAVFKYITPPIVKVEYVGAQYVSTFHVLSTRRSHVPTSCTYRIPRHVLPMWLGYPSSHGSTGSISSASRALILTQYKSPLSTCTILFIRSVTNKTRIKDVKKTNS